jgi:hypothetical protein
LANYIGAFVEYDKNNKTSFWHQYMRIRVRIDVRLPLKKSTKVMNKQGEWCTVKFKYEKLGIFCFVCGIMGHVENKCLVRFEMEEDNGVREWSSELRAENRRQGGRITSRWLREENGNHVGSVGSSTAAEAYSPATSTSMERVHDDVAHTAIPNQSNPSNPLQAALITRQEQLLATNTIAKHTPNHDLTNLNDSVNQFQLNPSFQSLLARVTSDPIPTIIAADNLNISDPTNNILSVTNINSPLVTTQKETAIPKTSSLPNNTFTFNSQQPINDMSANSSKPIYSNPRTTPNLLTIRYPDQNISDPKPTRPIQPKKTKNNPPKKYPTRNLAEPAKTQTEQEDMETQFEKKRRREDDSSSVTTTKPQSFLTAGPGSQACRDQ